MRVIGRQSRVVCCVGAVLTCDTGESSDYCRVVFFDFVTLVSSFGFNFQLVPLPRGLDFILLQRVFVC